jgi:hypothetical protein
MKIKLTDEQLKKLFVKSDELMLSGFTRLGQSYMNALWEIRPDIYNIITSEAQSDNNKFQGIDCFYNDDNIENLFNYLT